MPRSYKSLKGADFYDRTLWSRQQLQDHEQFQKFKANEYEVYRELHKVVLRDDGQPTLKKTAFSMPGYRKVIQEKNTLNEYEIDNADAEGEVVDEAIVQDPDEFLKAEESESESAFSEEIPPMFQKTSDKTTKSAIKQATAEKPQK